MAGCLTLSHQPADILQPHFSQTMKPRLRGEGGTQGQEAKHFQRAFSTKRAFGGGGEGCFNH